MVCKADLHTHTLHSDGTASVAAVLEYTARCTDVRVLAITDHDTIAGALEARRLAREFGIEVIVGEEISTTDGHLLALFIDQHVPPGRPAAETIRAVHAQGGLCIAAHPYDPLVSALGRAGLVRHCHGPRRGHWPLDAIEAFNASLVGPDSNRRAQRYGELLGLPLCGGSDSHSLSTIGTGYTLFEGRTADDLRRAIQAGQVTWGGQRWNVRHYADVVSRRTRRALARQRARLAA